MQAADIMRGWDGRMLAIPSRHHRGAARAAICGRCCLIPSWGNDADNYEWSEAAVALENIVQNQPAAGCPLATTTSMTADGRGGKSASKTRLKI